MKILAPLNDIKYLDSFIEAGADEFFLGFYEEADEARFGRFFELNRMSGFRRNSSRFSYEEILEVVKEIKSRDKDVFITLNSSGYTEEALRYMEPYVEGLVEAGVNGMIVSCVEMMDLVHKKGGKTVISGIGAAYNRHTAKFYKRNGASRIILPRDLDMTEVRDIISCVPGMEFETFIMRNGCVLSDGNCLGLHLSRHGGICKTLRESEKQLHVQKDICQEAYEEMQEEYDNCLYRHACGLCAVYDMIEAGVSACKVVGRLDKHDLVLEDIRLVKENIAVAEACSSREEFLEKMVLPEERKDYCKSFSCYFPEIYNPKLRDL